MTFETRTSIRKSLLKTEGETLLVGGWKRYLTYCTFTLCGPSRKFVGVRIWDGYHPGTFNDPNQRVRTYSTKILPLRTVINLIEYPHLAESLTNDPTTHPIYSSETWEGVADDLKD